jgi:hypothetical protein
VCEVPRLHCSGQLAQQGRSGRPDHDFRRGLVDREQLTGWAFSRATEDNGHLASCAACVLAVPVLLLR